MAMPMTFNSLVVESTNRCNARCRHCYQSSGPKGSDDWGLVSLSTEELDSVIRESAAIETLLPRFHLSGGEAFLDLDGCVRLFRTARDSGFADVSAVTNAFWARRRERAFEVALRIREAGLTSLEVSWDFWHGEWISPEAVANCLDACHELGIEANLRVLTTRSHSVAEAVSRLRPRSAAKASRVTSGPVFVSGRAALTLEPGDFYVSQTSLDESCHSTLNLTVNCLGNVYPCCASLDQTDLYVIGNIRRQSIVDIAEAIATSPLIRTVVFRGIAALAEIVESRGVRVGRDFRTICEMCRNVFTRPDCIEAATDHFVEVQQGALEKAIRLLEQR